MKEIYTSNHMWQLFEQSFLIDMGVISNATHDRKHADTALEQYVTETLMDIINTFFKSPFSDQSTTVQVRILERVFVRCFSISEQRLLRFYFLTRGRIMEKRNLVVKTDPGSLLLVVVDPS